MGGVLSTGSELVERTGLELSSRLWKKQKSVFCVVFRDIMLSMSRMQMNGGKLVMRMETDTIGSELPLTLP